MNKIPVGKTIAYAYSFTFGHLGTVIALAWLPLLIGHVATYCLYDLVDLSATPDQIRANPALVLRAAGVGLASYAIQQVFLAIVAVAMVRQALGLRTGSVKFHLAAGRDEWRMFAGYVRYFFALIGVVIISYLIMAILGVIGGLLMGAGTAGAAVGGLAILVGVVAIYSAAVLTLVRMGYLLSPSIVLERGGGIKRSYDLTKGNFWRIAGVWIATGLPVLLLLGAAEYWLIAPHLDIDFGNLPRTPDAVQEFTRRLDASMTKLQAEIMRQQAPLLAMGFVYSILSAALFYSGAAFAYRALAPSPPASAA